MINQWDRLPQALRESVRSKKKKEMLMVRTELLRDEAWLARVLLVDYQPGCQALADHFMPGLDDAGSSCLHALREQVLLAGVPTRLVVFAVWRRSRVGAVCCHWADRRALIGILGWC